MEYLKSFLIGGGVIAGSKIAANIMGPEMAPIVGGLPTGIIASFFLQQIPVSKNILKDTRTVLYFVFSNSIYSSCYITLQKFKC